MTPQVKDALFEWLASLIVGAIPLLAHLVMYLAVGPTRTPAMAWTIDLLFIVISTSGGSAVSVVNRLLKSGREATLGKAALILVALTVVLLSLASILYGASAAGYARRYATLEAVGLLVGSLSISGYLEFFMATRLTR